MMKKMIAIPIRPPGRPWASRPAVARVVSMTVLLVTCTGEPSGADQRGPAETFDVAHRSVLSVRNDSDGRELMQRPCQMLRRPRAARQNRPQPRRLAGFGCGTTMRPWH